MTKQPITAETSSKTEVQTFNTLMGLGTPAYCLRFASPAEANGKLEVWRNGEHRKYRITVVLYMDRTNVVAEDVFSRNREFQIL